MEVRIHRLGDLARLLFLGCIVCNVLLAIWIFTDIRKRGEGSGIFIALALVAGIPAAIIYSLVRIGDKAAVTGK
jgi:inner membrane protein involved in colicin E2 resistance